MPEPAVLIICPASATISTSAPSWYGPSPEANSTRSSRFSRIRSNAA